MLIHIGYHKTGTTWLQKRFFPKHPDLGVPFHYREILSNIVYPNTLRFNPESAKAYFQPRLNEFKKVGKIPVLSAERLCGNPYSGGYDSAEIANRLKIAFPDAKIWIVIRNQGDMILSTYKTYIDAGGTATFRDFIKSHPPDRYPSFSLDHFAYHYLIQHYIELFGKDRVLVSLYEEFRDSPRNYIKQLCDFLCVNSSLSFEVNKVEYKGRTDLNTLIQRPLNAFYSAPSLLRYSILNVPGEKIVKRILGACDKVFFKHVCKKLLWNTMERLVGDYYIESNQYLSRMLGINLSNKGFKI